MTVNNICPGMFPSESNGADLMEESQTFIKRMTPMQRAGTPTDLNTVGDMDAAVVFLASEESRYITGITLPATAGGLACSLKTGNQNKSQTSCFEMGRKRHGTISAPCCR